MAADDGKRLGAERKAAESCTSFHEVDLRGGCRGENGQIGQSEVPGGWDYCGYFFTTFSFLFFVLFCVVFLFVLRSFGGGILELFGCPNRLKTSQVGLKMGLETIFLQKSGFSKKRAPPRAGARF